MTVALKLTCMACGQANPFRANNVVQPPRDTVRSAGESSGRGAEMDSATHDKATRGDDLPLLVDYWAPWCGPCRAMAPEFAKAAQALAPRVRLAKINTEEFPVISQRLGIRGIPLLILYHRGRELARLSGARPASDIVAFVTEKLPGRRYSA